MLRRLYDWTMDLASRKNAVWALAAVAFVESSVFPLPPDILLIPMILAARNRAWRYAAICTIASVLGGMLGYAIGAGLYDSVGRPILEFPQALLRTRTSSRHPSQVTVGQITPSGSRCCQTAYSIWLRR